MKLLLLLTLVSCATQKMVLEERNLLPYKESSQQTKLTGNELPLNIVSVVDKRTRPEVGMAHTGVQYAKTPIYFDKSIQSIVKNYFINALEMRNVHVNDSAIIPLTIEINHFWVEEVIEKFNPEKAKCHIDMSFHLMTNTKKWSGNYWAKFTSGGDLSDGTERIAPTLGSCLNEIVEQLIKDKKFIAMIKE